VTMEGIVTAGPEGVLAVMKVEGAGEGTEGDEAGFSQLGLASGDIERGRFAGTIDDSGRSALVGEIEEGVVGGRSEGGGDASGDDLCAVSLSMSSRDEDPEMEAPG
jgi:hypothetical protein